MATYQDIHRIIKETIQVDAEPSKRWTPQLVKFINHDNEFYGKFYGSVDATEFFAANCALSNAHLSSCKLYDLSGNELDLNDVVSHMGTIDNSISALSDFCITLSDWVENTVCVNIENDIKKSEERVVSSIGTVSADVEEIKAKIKGGVVVYRGMIKITQSKIPDTFRNLIWESGIEEHGSGDAVVYPGYSYLINTDKTVVIEGTVVGNNDFVYINNKAEHGFKVRDLVREHFDIADSMDTEVHQQIKEISSDVDGLKSISADHEQRISIVEHDTFQISTDLNILSSKVDGLNGNFDFDTDGLSVITKITQTKGKVEVDARRLVSSDVKELPSYVQNEIKLSVANLTADEKITQPGYILTTLTQHNGVIKGKVAPILSNYVVGLSDYVGTKIDENIDALDSSVGTENEFIISVLQENGKLVDYVHGKVTNDFIDENTIAQNRITDLSSDLYNMSAEISTIARRNRGDVSWMGDFKWGETLTPPRPLSGFLLLATGNKEQSFGYTLRKGFLYRNIADQQLSTNDELRTFRKDDYILVNDNVVISNATFDSFRYIKDYAEEVKELSDYGENTYVKLSGDNQISGNNTYGGRQIFNCSVDFNDNHVTFNGFQVTNSGYIAKASTGNLIVGGQLRCNNDLLIVSDQLKFTDVSVNFKDISDDFQTQISNNRTDINTISSTIENLSVDNAINEGEILTSLSQTDGKISYGVTKLLSSHVEGLSDYVQDELTKKVESLSVDVISSEGKYIDSVWEENGKISATTKRIVSSDIDELANYVQNEINLSIANITSNNTIEGKIISSITQENGVVKIETTDILSSDVVGLSDYVEDEIGKNNVKLSGEYVHLSGNNSISGYNAFLGDLSVTTMSVMSFGDIYDMGEEFLSARLPALDNPYVSKIHEQINDIIKYSGIDVQQLGNIDDTICEEIKDRTERIYEIAYGSIPSVETFGDVTNCLNAVLGVLKDKETGISLEDRLQRLQGGIDAVHEMAQILNQDLSSLCVHVNTDIGELREDVSELSSNLNTLSADYHNLKDGSFVKSETYGVESHKLIVTDELFNTGTGKHDRYTMTFLSGTLVLEKI